MFVRLNADLSGIQQLVPVLAYSAKQRLGIRTDPVHTTVRLSCDEIGRKAFDALYRSAKGLCKTGEQMKVTTSLIVRESTAPTNGAS